MTNTTLKAQIDSQITNETLSNSISPTDVGGNLKSVVDYIDQFYVKEYIAQIAQSGTNAPTAQVVIKDKITLNTPSDSSFVSLSYFRDSAGVYRVRFTRKNASTDYGMASVVFGDGSCKITGSLIGNTGGTEFWKEWEFKTIDYSTGLPADGMLSINGATYLTIRINTLF